MLVLFQSFFACLIDMQALDEWLTSSLGRVKPVDTESMNFIDVELLLLNTKTAGQRAVENALRLRARDAETTCCWRLLRQHARKGLALPQAWSAGDVVPIGRARCSDSRVAAPVLRAHAHTLL